MASMSPRTRKRSARSARHSVAAETLGLRSVASMAEMLRVFVVRSALPASHAWFSATLTFSARSPIVVMIALSASGSAEEAS